jgi:predicted MPP superfamily phosphohydrolase
MRSSFGTFIFIAIMVLLDSYVFLAVKMVSQNAQPKTKTIIYAVYWGISILSIVSFLLFAFTQQDFLGKKLRTYMLATVIGLFIAKFVAVVFFVIDDLRRLIQWVASKLFSANTEMAQMNDGGISRSVFLSWLGLAAGTSIFGSLLYGFSNKYNYTIKRIKPVFDNVPLAFKGLKIVHISDIHSGSFMNKKAVEKGVQKILDEKPDVIFFTGDLVNDLATEMNDYIDVFSKLKAPMGVYSTFGNHDYGDYVQWPDRTDEFREKQKAAGKHLLSPLQQKNLDDLANVHASLGWRLLMDEHITLKKGDAEIAVLGVQNISGKARFYTYGNLAKAYAGTEKYPFKILLSHDPSHWDAEVKPNYKDIDVMLSGHTHGMQFGIEIPGFKWSPVQYVYKQWSGLYEDAKQKLYINQGFGFLGYPGRVGVLPEITVIEL